MAIKDKTVLKAQVQTLFPDNNANEITPQRVRDMLDDMIDSDLNQTTYDAGETGIVNASKANEIIASKSSPGSIPAGRLVYIKDGDGVEMVDNTFSTGACVGITIEEITDTAQGKILISGEITAIDTTGLTEGDPLWLSATPGIATATPPVAGEKAQVVGIVVSSGFSGIIAVAISDIRNTDADFSIYDSTGNSVLIQDNVQDALDEIDSLLLPLGAIRLYSESDTVDTTGLDVFQPKVEIINALSAGDYLVEYCAEVSVTSTTKSIEVEVRYNVATVIGGPVIETKDPTSWYTISGFKKITHAGGPIVIDMKFRRTDSAGASTVSIRNARLSLKSA